MDSNLQVKQVGPWPSGVNLLDPVGTLRPTEVSRCENMRLDPYGNPYKRPGFKKYNPNKVNGNNPLTLLTRFYRETDNSKKLIASSNGKLKYGSDIGGAWTEITLPSPMHISNLVSKAAYKDRLYLADGLQPLRFNGAGNYAYNAGFPTLGVPTVADSATTGGLVAAEKYKYLITPVLDNMGEGFGTASALYTVGSGKSSCDVTIPLIPALLEGTTRRIYRTTNNGTVFHFLAEVDNTVLTYHDGQIDANLGDEYVPVHSPRADCRFVFIGPDDRAYWFGRSGVNASIVEVSEVGWPDRIRDDDFFSVNNNDSDIVTAGCKVPGGMLFFKRNSTWLLRQFGSGLINLSNYYGCTAPYSIQLTPDGCIFLSQQGKVCVYNGQITEVARRVRPELRFMGEAAMNRVTSAYHQDRYLLAYDYLGQSGHNSRVLEYDLVGNKWDGPHSSPVYSPSSMLVLDSLKDQGELYFGGASDGYIYILDENLSKDDGIPFNSSLRTGQNALEGHNEKQATRAIVRGIFSGDSYLEVNIHREDGSITKANPIKVGTTYGDVYGTAKYGESKYSTVRSVFAEDSYDIDTRTHQPVIEVTDGGKGTVLKLDALDIIYQDMSLI